MKKYILFFFFFLITNFAFGQVTLPYTEDFEGTDNKGWALVNGSANKWFVGSAVNNGGSRSLYISNDASGNNNNYTGNQNSVTHAYRDISIPAGVTEVTLSFDWRANGQGNSTKRDYLEVRMVPISTPITAGTAITTGTLLAQLNRNNNFSNWSNPTLDTSAFAGNTMRLVFTWINNDDGTINNNAAAIDNLSIVSNSCSGTPTGGTASLSATTGNPNSTFTASVTGSSAGSGFTYQWQSAPSSTGPWTNISGATSSGSTTITAPATETTTYYRRVITCTSSGGVAYSTVVSYTTSVSYCTPNFNNTDKGRLYINSFQFIGVLNNPPANTSGFASGYQDFTSFTPIAEQPQGTAVNVIAYRGTNGTTNGTWKAWVDWNRDGDFTDSGEQVYNMITFSTSSVTFGFVIPAGQAIGNYRLRIGTFSDNNFNFSSCSTASGFGEMEDYTFKVVADCSAKVNSVNTVNAFDGERCGPGSVRLSAKGTASTVSFNWYDYDETTKIYTYLATGITYNTPSISSTKTYYVKAITNTDSSAANYCETPFFYPVEARIDPNPTVTFSTSDPAICGEDKPSLLLTASGDKFQDEFFEDFSSGLGVFSNDDSESTLKSTLASWQNKPTPYIPTIAEGYEGLSPAMSSGYFGGNYAMINSDINRTTAVKYHLVSGNRNVNGFLNLQLDFDLYHFSIAYDNTEGYIEVSYTLDGSVANPTWVPLVLPGLTTPSTGSPTRYWQNIGNPLKWQHFTVNIPGSNFTATNFRIRFSHFAQGQVTSGSHPQKFYEAITTVDNVRLSGYKIITTPFKWNSAATTVYDTDCVTPLPINDLRSTVCVKPNPTELENLNWNLHANATFSNGCPADGYYDVNNDTKTWRQPGIIDWNQGAQWRPTSVPTINKCVIVRTPVELPTNTNGSHGLARSVIVKPGGSLIIQPKSSLTIQNHIKNETAPSDVLVKSDANLIQFNDAAANSGNITVQRNSKMKRLDYTYWGSPVSGQKLRSFSPATLNTRFYVYNEANDYFDGIFVKNTYPTDGMYPTPTLSLTPVQPEASYDFEKAKGYAVRSPNNFTTSVSDFMGNFVGTPNNGVITININKSANTVISGNTYVHGINLISNPYPSNIDLDMFFAANPSLQKVASFWTNINPNPAMQGSGYPNGGFINNYAVYNNVGGLPAPGPACEASPSVKCSPTPTNIVKVGQGFLVHVASSVAPGTNNIPITFNNSIRSATNSGSFFNGKIANATKDRYWLELKTPLDFVTPLLVGYVKGSTNAYDEDYDVELNVIGADSFYTILDNKKLGIQGRKYPVNTEDVVSLGAIFHETGMYMISLTNKEGVFANGQQIYLRDNLLGVVANLSQGAYSFSAQAGEVNNRFEILYNYRSLGTDTIDKAGFTVYKEGNDFVIKANETIKAIKIYDASGKLIYKFNANSKEHRVDATKYQSGVYMIDITTSSKSYNKKIIK